MSVWCRDHTDHHVAVLMDPDGTFAATESHDAENQSGKAPQYPMRCHRRDFSPTPGSALNDG